MKVCVTTAGEGLDAPVDSRLGRAQNLVIVDTETMEAETVTNPGREAGHGAGIQAAQEVARTGASVLLAAHCGPKAFEVFRQAGIEVYAGAHGTVQTAVEGFLAGTLNKLERADTAVGLGE